MAENRIDSIFDYPLLEAEVAKVEKRLAEVAATIKTFPKAQVFYDANGLKDLTSANKELSTVSAQLKIKNQELTNSIKEQRLETARAAEERKAAAAAQREADRQAKIDAKEKLAAEKALNAQQEVAGRERILALKKQAEAEQELEEATRRKNAENKKSTDLGTFDISQGSGQSGTQGLVGKEKVSAAKNVTFSTDEQRESLMYLVESEVALKKNRDLQKDLNSQLEKGLISQAQYNEQLAAAKGQELELKKQIQLTNAELKARTNADFAVQGSIDAARAQNAILTKERNSLDISNPEDVARLKELNAEIDRNNELIDKNNDLLGRQKINIGNYPQNAFSKTFKSLNAELEAVQGKLVSGNFKGEELDKLTAKLTVLQNATALTGKQFTTTGAQSKAFMEAGVQIGQVYGKDSEFFKQFSEGVRSGAANIKGMANEVAGVATKGKGFMGFLSQAYSGLRKLANIIPGAGIATLVLLLLGPLQAAGAAIVKWSKSATKAGREFEELQRRIKETNEIVDKSADSYAKATSEVIKLKNDVQLAKQGLLDKDKVLKEYNETMGKTTGHLTDFDKLEAKLVESGPDYIKLLFLKAKATAAYALAGEAARKALTAQQDAEKEFGAMDFVATNKLNLLKQAFGFGDLADAGINAAKQVNENAKKIKEEQEKSFASLNEQGDKFQKEAAELAKRRGWNFGLTDPETAKKSAADNERLLDNYRKKSLAEQAKFDKEELEMMRRKFKDKSADENRSFDERLRSAKAYYNVSLLLIEQQTKAEEDALKLETDAAKKKAGNIKDAKKRADTLNAIEQYRIDKLKTIQQEGAVSTTALEKEMYELNTSIAEQSFKKIQDAAKETYRVIAEQSKLAFQNQLDQIDISANDQILALQRSLEDGSIKSVEDYNRRKNDIEKKADIETQKLNLKRLEGQKAFYDAMYGVLGFRNLALEKAIQDAIIKLKESGYEQEKAIQDKRKDLNRQLQDQLADTFQDIVNSGFDRQQQKHESELKNIDEKSQRQIDAINASGLAEAEKERRIMAIEKQADHQRKQIEDRIRRTEVSRAKFERAASIARIVQSTAEAVMAALGAKPYTPANIALAATAGVIGAAQIASVLAQPLPHYEKGTKNAKKGLSVVGEKGSELVVDKHGKMFLTPSKPTLMDLAGGEQIFKHDITKDMLNHYNLLHILQKAQTAKQPIPVQNNFNQRAIDILSKIERKAPFVIQVQNGMETGDYYKRNIKN